MNNRPDFWIVCCLLTMAGAPAVAQTHEEDATEQIRSDVPYHPSKNPPKLRNAAEKIMRQTNAFRRQEGRSAVEEDQTLTAAAKAFASYMAKHDQYGHHADGRTPAERAKQQGYEYCIVRENIAYQFRSRGFSTDELAEAFFQGWKESPGHRENMLAEYVSETAVALAQSDKTGYYYAVQIFARPRSAKTAFAVSNRSGEAIEYALSTGKETKRFSLDPRFTRTHTRCRPAKLRFSWENSEDGSAIDAGAMYVVRKEGDAFAVEKKENQELETR